VPAVSAAVAAADYSSTRQKYPWLIHLQNSNEDQPMKSPMTGVVSLQSCDLNLGNFSHIWDVEAYI